MQKKRYWIISAWIPRYPDVYWRRDYLSGSIFISLARFPRWWQSPSKRQTSPFFFVTVASIPPAAVDGWSGHLRLSNSDIKCHRVGRDQPLTRGTRLVIRRCWRSPALEVTTSAGPRIIALRGLGRRSETVTASNLALFVSFVWRFH